MMRNKLFSIAFVLVFATSPGGCMQTFKDYVDAGISIGTNIYKGVVTVLPVIARDIDLACEALRTPVDPSTPPACAAKFNKVKAAWRSACTNTALLTDDVAGNYVAKIKSDVNAAAKAC